MSESQKLIEWAFAAYEGRRLYEAGKPIQQLTVWKSSVNEVPIGFRDDVTAVTDAGKGWEITTELTIRSRRSGRCRPAIRLVCSRSNALAT